MARNFAELEPHADSWNRLAFGSLQQLPMSSHAWVSSYFEHYLAQNESWVCLLAFQDSELVGVMPSVAKTWNLLGLKVSVLGLRQSSQSCSVDILAKPGLENIVIPALVEKMVELYPRQIGIVFDRLPENSPTIAVFEELANFTLIKEFDSVGAYIPIGNDFAKYRSNLSGNFRSNLNKANKKLHALENANINFINGKEATAEYLTQLVEVEAKSWKEDVGTAIINCPQALAFYRSLCQRLSSAGFLEWQILTAEGKAIAVNLAVRLERLVLIWKLGYDASYSKCSPGSLLLEEAVKLACESPDIDEINFMTDHSWYDNWKMEKRQYYYLRLYSHKSPFSMLGYMIWNLRRKLRKIF
ncbi:GNAT family N-acetyltransferase [Calothrix sp. 336/3]|uniref:GNAT family N-acetyltransferase n=1 Tax=Calothrix sp. 336/3 TaxID=1337936 RepID=UPI00143BAB3F|nr:GNAT family N-acetyltransferase [Calothrix sp. 336/3]